MTYTYETNGDAIYRQSFSIIRSEADLKRFSPLEERVACRMIHAAGMVELAQHIQFSPDFAEAAEAAIQRGAPILCDARMVSEGNTRSAAALELWRDQLEGAVVAIGNAPTALFHLLNMLQDPSCPRPAAIIGCPVGFVGAAESKDALREWGQIPFVIVEGRLGGSAITVAAVNALASAVE